MEDSLTIVSNETGPAPVIFLGDSHVQYFKIAEKHFLFAPRVLTGQEVGGATAVGFRNPNSMTDSLGQFRRFIDGKSTSSIMILHLGEVDCGYVIWYRAEKYQEPMLTQIEHSISAYLEFVDELIGRGFTKIIIAGATLPTISDTDQIGEVVQKRSNIKATQRQRTDLTLQYNERLQEEAKKRGVFYTDVTEDVLDPETQLVASRFRNKNPADHHMFYELAAVEWAKRLNPLLDVSDPREAPWVSWKATQVSFIKAWYAHSKDMPESMKKAISGGEILRARLHAARGEMLVVSEASLDGEALDVHLRLIHAAHWKRME